MTYKRFEYISFDGFTDNGEYLTPYQVAELLNDFHKENKELRLLVDTLKEQNQKFKARLNDLGVEYL